jgi:hypothetical protein
VPFIASDTTMASYIEKVRQLVAGGDVVGRGEGSAERTVY